MARIRTIKPDFFRHEALQDLEIANPGSYVMLVFAGIWGHCDKAGRFEWKPRMLKLDILPFIEFGMEKTLMLLVDAGLVTRYSVDGKEYACIKSFEKHQRINGKESQEPEKHPSPSEYNQGSNREAIEKQPRSQEGKGKEEEEEEEGKRSTMKQRASRSTSTSSAEAFDSFWKSYPKKKNKGQAEKAWAKLSPSDELVSEIISAIEAAKAGASWKKSGGEFIPYPASWISAKGWLDSENVDVQLAYCDEAASVISSYNEILFNSGWPEAVDDSYSAVREESIKEFILFSEKQNWIQAYFTWMRDNLDPKSGLGFDWVIKKETYIRAREGNFINMKGAA